MDFFFTAPVLYFCTGSRLSRQKLLTSKKKKKDKEEEKSFARIYPNFPNFARNLPEVLHRLGGGGAQCPAAPRLLRLWVY